MEVVHHFILSKFHKAKYLLFSTLSYSKIMLFKHIYWDYLYIINMSNAGKLYRHVRSLFEVFSAANVCAQCNEPRVAKRGGLSLVIKCLATVMKISSHVIQSSNRGIDDGTVHITQCWVCSLLYILVDNSVCVCD